MNIKTITCHDVYNCGASLQTYALMTYLKCLGHDVEIINYKPSYLCKQYGLFAVNNPRFDKPILKQAYILAKLPSKIKKQFEPKKKVFDLFTDTYLNVTKRVYKTNDELKNNLPIADIYFAGSDQIWNSYFQNGKDPAFYLDFVGNNGIKASYAASFATEDVDDVMKSFVKEKLTNLDFIAVRELSALKIVNEFGLEATQVLDPVFLLNKDYWDIFSSGYQYDEDYIFVYDFDTNEDLKECVKKIAFDKGLKIYSYFNNDYCDQSFENAGPIEFVSLIKNAKVILSNSFHATAFSIIFEKDFWVINRKEKINTRMRDLTILAGIPERVLKNKDDYKDIAIDYKSVNKNINKCLETSKQYIDYVLSKGEK